MERISEITRRDTLDGGTAGPLQEEAMPGGEPTDGVSQEVVLEPQEQAVSRERPWKRHWLDHGRFNGGDIRV